MTRTDLAIRLTLLAVSIVLPAGLMTACADASASPAQPIAFSHKAHTDNEIDCSFCHDYAEDYAAAGIPKLELCVTCHFAMPQDTEALQKIFEYEEAGEEIPWVRLYEIRPYAYFSHKWHVRAEIDCATCHGDIGQSVQAVRHMTYDMDWCVTCHEERDAPTGCVVCHK